jgi:hypothetical protein
MTDLSPAAEAVLNAVTLKRYDVPYFACPKSIDQIKSDIAAALRAAAENVASPEQADPDSQWDLGFVAACAAIYGDLYAIAAELEGAA